VFYGLPFLVEVSLPSGVVSVDSVMMMGLSSVTHSNDFSQRRIMMDFSEVGDDSIMATAPWQPEVAPPGNYMVVVMAGGIPSVAKFVGLSRASSTAQIGDEVLWGGEVRLDRDFTVEAGDVLRIVPGTEILVLADEDSANVGVDGGRIELIVKGKTLAEGTEAEPIHIATFGGDGSSGEWRGIRFVDTADNEISDLEWVEFESAFNAVELDTLSGNLWDCSFESSQNSDVYIPRDTRLVEGHEWRFNAPMLVLVENEDAAARGEDTLLVEVVVNGAIRTERPPGAGANDRVVFTSTEENSLRGNDWHGLTVIGTGFNDAIGVAEILDAEFAYARYPLSFFVAHSARVGNSQFHHYEEDAITDWASDAWIHDCFVERGTGLEDAPPDPAGLNGIRLVSTFATVERDTVLYQISNGIWVQGSQSYCLLTNPPPAPAGDVLLRENVIVGDPEANNTACTGILAGWICHEERIRIEDSNIQNWTGRGVRLDNCSDALLECNCILGNRVGFKHDRKYRTVNATNGINKARENNFDDSIDANVKTGLGPGNNSSGLWVGVSGDESVGRNRLELLNEDTHNYDLDAFEYNRVDSLQVNIWYDKYDQILNSEANINAWNEYSPEPSPLEQELNVSGYLTSSNDDPECSTEAACDLTGLQGRFGTVRTNPRLALDATSQGQSKGYSEATQAEVTPERYWLSMPLGNPVRNGQAMVSFDVPQYADGTIRIAVYSTSGRLVRDLFGPGRSVPGRHTILWKLDDENGRQVSAGIYFVRMSAPGFIGTEKVLVLR
jgi:hypothetical protein